MTSGGLIRPTQARHIWSARWSTVKVLYVINRYGSLVSLGACTLQTLGIWRSTAPEVSSIHNLSSDSVSDLRICYFSSATTRRSHCRSSSSCRTRRYTVRHLRLHPNHDRTFLSVCGRSVLVLLRAWATWGRHFKILLVLATLFVIYAAASIAILTWGIVSVGCTWQMYARRSITTADLRTDDGYPFSFVVGTCIEYIPCAYYALSSLL